MNDATVTIGCVHESIITCHLKTRENQLRESRKNRTDVFDISLDSPIIEEPMNEATRKRWLAKLAKLRIDRKGTPAPHKPLLLLVVIELAEQGLLPKDNPAAHAGTCFPILDILEDRRPSSHSEARRPLSVPSPAKRRLLDGPWRRR